MILKSSQFKSTDVFSLMRDPFLRMIPLLLRHIILWKSLLNNLRVQERQNRVCTTVAIAAGMHLLGGLRHGKAFGVKMANLNSQLAFGLRVYGVSDSSSELIDVPWIDVQGLSYCAYGLRGGPVVALLYVHHCVLPNDFFHTF